jgi:oxygen-dependent protoporphyrinogen oxidase
MSTPERAEVVVVGGGIAGLAAAWELRDRDVVVLESTDRTGGRMWSESRDPYWLNYGGHVISGPDSFTGRLMEAAGVDGVELPGILSALSLNGKLLAGGRVETYPLRAPLRRSDRAALIRAGARVRLAVIQYGRVSRLRAGESEADRRARVLAYRDDETFADFLGDVPPDVDEVFRATIRRSSGEPEEVSAGYGIGYFQLVWDRSKGLTRNVLGGSGMLPAAITRALGGKVRTSSPVTEVVESDGGVAVTYEAQGTRSTIHARAAVVAAPAPAARSIVAGLPDDVARALEGVTYGPYVVGSFLTGETSPMPYDGLYAAATPKASFNMLFNMASSLRRGGPRKPGGSLMVYAAADLARELDGMSDEAVETRFLDDLHERFPQMRGTVKEAVIRRWPTGVPHPRPGRHLLQPALTRDIGPIHLAGDYLGITYIETAIETGTSAAHRVRRLLDCGAA